MTELEQLLTHSLTALVEQSEQQTALINALDARLQKMEQQLAHTAGASGPPGAAANERLADHPNLTQLIAAIRRAMDDADQNGALALHGHVVELAPGLAAAAESVEPNPDGPWHHAARIAERLSQQPAPPGRAATGAPDGAAPARDGFARLLADIGLRHDACCAYPHRSGTGPCLPRLPDPHAGLGRVGTAARTSYADSARRPAGANCQPTRNLANAGAVGTSPPLMSWPTERARRTAGSDGPAGRP